MSYAGPKDLDDEGELKTLPGVGSTVPVGRVTFFNEALRQFLKTFNDKNLPSVVTKRWLAIRQIFTVTAGASEPDQPGQFARQHFHPIHGSSAHRTFQRITVHWMSKTAHIMPRRIETGVRLNARMSKVSTEPTPRCGVQISNSWMSANQAGTKAGRPQCRTPKRRRGFGFLLRSWNRRDEFGTGLRCYCRHSSILISHALWRLRSVLIRTSTFSTSSLVKRKVSGSACSQTPHRL